MELNSQLNKYLQAITPRTKKDLKAIEDFLRTVDKDTFEKNSNLEPGTMRETSFYDFLLSSGIKTPLKFEIIFIDECICFVKGLMYNDLHVYFHLDSEGVLCKEKSIFQINYYRPANEQEIFLLQRAVNNEGLFWCTSSYKLEIKRIPLKYQPITISILGTNIIRAFGIFREFDKDGNIIMYCYFDNSGQVKYSMNECFGHKMDFQIHSLSKKDRKQLDAALKVEGKRWNDEYKRIENIKDRVKAGNMYYYISESFEIKSACDKRLKETTNRSSGEDDDSSSKKKVRLLDPDEIRYRSSNYFRLKNEAEEVLNKIKELRMNMYTAPIPKKKTPKA